METQTQETKVQLPKLSRMEMLLANSPQEAVEIQRFKKRRLGFALGFSFSKPNAAVIPRPNSDGSHYYVKGRYGFVETSEESKVFASSIAILVGMINFIVADKVANRPIYNQLPQFQVPAMTVDLNSQYKATAMLDEEGRKVVFVTPLDNESDFIDSSSLKKPSVRLEYNSKSQQSMTAMLHNPEKNPGLKDYASVSRIDELYAKVFTNPNRRPAKN